MQKVRFVGLDVHKSSITLAVADSDGSAPQVLATIPHDVGQLLRRLRALAKTGEVRCAYEAGPTGFGLQRRLKKAGFECIVVAPSLIPTQKRKSKTDDLDAVRIARFLRSSDLEAIWVPDQMTEAMRDLSRTREDALEALQRCRQQLSSFLLRHDRKYDGKSRWTKAHLAWIRSQRFELAPQQRVLEVQVHAIDEAQARLDGLEKDLAALAPTWEHFPLVTALQALRGMKLVTAFTIVAEIGDFRRFRTARHLMSYLGLVPGEHSSGDRTRRGSITRAGNAHVRRVLVEAGWNNRFPYGASVAVARRRALVSDGVRRIAEKAQARLSARMRLLSIRGKESNKIVVALARELAGFVWAIGQENRLLA
jgi:transposase